MPHEHSCETGWQSRVRIPCSACAILTLHAPGLVWIRLRQNKHTALIQQGTACNSCPTLATCSTCRSLNARSKLHAVCSMCQPHSSTMPATCARARPMHGTQDGPSNNGTAHGTGGQLEAWAAYEALLDQPSPTASAQGWSSRVPHAACVLYPPPQWQ